MSKTSKIAEDYAINMNNENNFSKEEKILGTAQIEWFLEYVQSYLKQRNAKMWGYTYKMVSDVVDAKDVWFLCDYTSAFKVTINVLWENRHMAEIEFELPVSKKPLHMFESIKTKLEDFFEANEPFTKSKEETGLEVRKIAEEQVININEAKKLIKEYEESFFNEDDVEYNLEDLITAEQMLGEAITILKKMVDYKKQ